VRRYSFSQADVAVRGYSQQYSPRLLVLVNGRQVYLDDYGYTAWQAIPVQLAEIRQIEVVRGPNSALFGFNAVGGVINIITYDPLSDSTNVATVRGGTQSYAAGSAVTTLHAGSTAGVRLSAGAWRADEFSTASLPAFYRPYYTSPYEFSASADGRLRITPHVELTAEGTVARAKDLEAPPAPDFLTTDYRTYSGKFALSADTSAGLLGMQAYLNHLGSEFTGTNTGVNLQNDTVVVQANDLFKLRANHTVRFGLEYRQNRLSGIAPSDLHEQIYAASAMWDWQMSPQIALVNSVRVDSLTLRFAGPVAPGSRFTAEDYSHARLTAPSFNSALVCSASERDTVRLMVARGVQAPSLADFGIETGATSNGFAISYTGNPTLKAATLMNYEADYDRVLPRLGATLRLAAYYEKTTDLLASALNAPLMPVAGGVNAYSQNVGSSQARGGELGIHGTTTVGARWNVSYSVISITDHLIFPSLSGPALLLDYRSATPVYAVNASLGYSTGPWELDLQGHWQSSFTDYLSVAFNTVAPEKIDAGLTLNVRINYAVTPHVSLGLVAESVNERRSLDAAGVPVERRVFGTLTVHF
jgi:iron complex outermembrane receptor protein